MDPALWELLRSHIDSDNREVEALIRLLRPNQTVKDVRIVSRFGNIATCRLPAHSILRTRQDRNVVSLKAARPLGPETQPYGPEGLPNVTDADVRRPPDLALTGAGVVVGIVDWGCDFDHPNFKNPDGTTRILALWDQRGPASPDAPQPYGYGALHSRQQIDDALQTKDPYDALGYRLTDAEYHGTHVMDIAAGNGRAGGPAGIAPEAGLVFVHLADRGTSGSANLGDSVRILEAVDFIARTAQPRPWVINISVGRHGGPHDGSTLGEQALDHLLRAAPGRLVVQSAGNYYDAKAHARGRLEPEELRSLTMVIQTDDVTPNEMEVWYSGQDEFDVQVASPGGRPTRWVHLREQASITEDDRVVGRVYHRNLDPNNHSNHIEVFLYPGASAGAWSVTLRAVKVRRGVFHAWLERDESCPQCQTRFDEADADRTCTIGTIANGRLPLVVGAYDAHSPTRKLAAFSSAGPTRDGRNKPDLIAPGVRVIAARSAPPGSTGSPGLLTCKSGTSMAAPHATGTAALLLQGAPYLTADEIRALLMGTAAPAAGTAERSGHGYLDTAAAVKALSATTRGVQRPWHHPMETTVNPKFEAAFPLSLTPDLLYRQLLYGQAGRAPTWLETGYTVLARPGEAPESQPAAGDILLRVALGEPGLGHVAVLSDSPLIPQSALDRAHVRSENGGPGLYAPVIENSAIATSRPHRVARRILDATGHTPPGQMLLRPRPSPDPVTPTLRLTQTAPPPPILQAASTTAEGAFMEASAPAQQQATTALSAATTSAPFRQRTPSPEDLDSRPTTSWAVASVGAAGGGIENKGVGAGFAFFDLLNRESKRAHMLRVPMVLFPSIGLPLKRPSGKGSVSLPSAGAGMSDYVMFDTARPMSFADFDRCACRVTSANMALFWGYSVTFLTLWDGFFYVGDLMARSVRMSGTGVAMFPSGSVGHGWCFVTRGSGRPLGSVNVPLVLVPQEDDYAPEPRLAYMKLDAREDRPVTLPADVLFAFDSDEISADAVKDLFFLADLLNNRLRRPVKIAGHTDGIGTAVYNQDLSRRRASAVKAWLVRNRVYGASEFRVVGYGESQPLVPERKPDGSDDPAARAKNRRVMVHAAWGVP